MKKFYYLLFLAIGLTACSVESMDSTEELLTADAKFKIQSTVAITPASVDLCAGEILTFTVDVQTDSNFQIQQKDAEGEWQQVYLANRGQSGTAAFDVILLEGENVFRHTNINGGGFTQYSTAFNGILCNSCENLLLTELICGETKIVNITFTAEETGDIVIQGGLTNGATIKAASSNVLIRNTTHQGVENSRANVTRWEGNVEACQEVTISIEYSGGNGIGDWTAERDEVVLSSAPALECN